MFCWQQLYLRAQITTTNFSIWWGPILRTSLPFFCSFTQLSIRNFTGKNNNIKENKGINITELRYSWQSIKTPREGQPLGIEVDTPQCQEPCLGSKCSKTWRSQPGSGLPAGAGQPRLPREPWQHQAASARTSAGGASEPGGNAMTVLGGRGETLLKLNARRPAKGCSCRWRCLR